MLGRGAEQDVEIGSPRGPGHQVRKLGNRAATEARPEQVGVTHSKGVRGAGAIIAGVGNPGQGPLEAIRERPGGRDNDIGGSRRLIVGVCGGENAPVLEFRNRGSAQGRVGRSPRKGWVTVAWPLRATLHLIHEHRV